MKNVLLSSWNKCMHIVFTSLAFNQTEYFVELCVELKKLGLSSSIISFHEDSNDYIEKKGVTVFNVFERGSRCKNNLEGIERKFLELVKSYKIESANILLSHEKAAFNLTEEVPLKRKFVEYIAAVEDILKELKSTKGNELVVFQELGAFASLLSTYFVARENGISHFFMEPAIFKGRMFLVKNSLFAHKPIEKTVVVDDELKLYLEQIKRTKDIVIPKKDVGYYRHPFFKIASKHNIRRLCQKLLSKYVKGRREEFNHIGSFVFRHVKMLVNRIRFVPLYSQLPREKFIYYPLHVPIDVALTVRAPLYLDQYALIDYISRNIPPDYKLVVKEHPAMVGLISFGRMKSLLRNHPNIQILHPKINNHTIIGNMELLITVNSKTGAESLMQGKKVICLGDAFYSNSSSVNFIGDINNLYKLINKTISELPPSGSSINNFFQCTWDETYPGELYYCSPSNISVSARSIAKSIGFM
ncbi:hypothetical protein EBQ74_04110 [bacterium]|nr:hypothetical protein [bacterium]